MTAPLAPTRSRPRNASRLLAQLILIVLGLSAVGCQRPIAERNALMDQNKELQGELNRARAALDSAMADMGALSAENARLQDENARLRAGQAAGPTTNRGATGFEGIEDVEVDQTATTVTVRVASDILFASGKVDLKDSAKQTLNDVAGVLNAQYAGKTIRVEGYTDTDPIRRSGWKDNLELSLERAAAVHRYLQSRGIDDERMYAAGFGATHVLDSKPASRRVEIVVVLGE